MRTPIQMFLGDLLPFSLIFSMMDDIYESLYNLKVCGAFRTMFTTFISIIALTVFVGIICTCHQLYKQDHQWWQRQFSYNNVIDTKFHYLFTFEVQECDQCNMTFTWDYYVLTSFLLYTNHNLTPSSCVKECEICCAFILIESLNILPWRIIGTAIMMEPT